MARDKKDKGPGGGAPQEEKRTGNGGGSNNPPQESPRDLRGAAQISRLVGTSQAVKGMALGLGFIALAVLGSCIKMSIPGGHVGGDEPERLEPPTETIEIRIALPKESKWVGDPKDGDWITIPAGSIGWEIQNPQNEKGENEGLNILFWNGTIVTREPNGRVTIRYADGRASVQWTKSKAFRLDGVNSNKFKLAPYSREGGGVAIVRWTFYVRE